VAVSKWSNAFNSRDEINPATGRPHRDDAKLFGASRREKAKADKAIKTAKQAHQQRNQKSRSIWS
jgi:hypothetical protein